MADDERMITGAGKVAWSVREEPEPTSAATPFVRIPSMSGKGFDLYATPELAQRSLAWRAYFKQLTPENKNVSFNLWLRLRDLEQQK